MVRRVHHAFPRRAHLRGHARSLLARYKSDTRAFKSPAHLRCVNKTIRFDHFGLPPVHGICARGASGSSSHAEADFHCFTALGTAGLSPGAGRRWWCRSELAETGFHTSRTNPSNAPRGSSQSRRFAPSNGPLILTAPSRSIVLPV